MVEKQTCPLKDSVNNCFKAPRADLYLQFVQLTAKECIVKVKEFDESQLYPENK